MTKWHVIRIWTSSRSTLCVLLAGDAAQKAKSGHPGTPMNAAPAAYTPWQRVLRYDPASPGWRDRDRFVLSSGHASMLPYSLIHLAGIKATNPTYEEVRRNAVTLDDVGTFVRGTPNKQDSPEAHRGPPRRRRRRRRKRAPVTWTTGGVGVVYRVTLIVYHG